MSSSNHHSNGANGTLTLKSFAELADVLDLNSLPPGPHDIDNDVTADGTQVDAPAAVVDEAHRTSAQPLDLATVIAQLASVSADLENVARFDAGAREQATIELAQYETLAAERHQAERALAEAHGVRTTAERLVTEAFTEQALAEAARHAAVARAAELTCTQLLAERIRAADELACRPHLARVLAERRRREQERVEAAQRAERDLADRLSSGIAAARQARAEGRLDTARELLVKLARDFPADREIQSQLDAVRWQVLRLRTAPAEEALSAVLRRPYRDDPKAAVACLAALDMRELPEDLGRRIFGVWSRLCLKLVRQESMHDPRRYSSATSRGLIFARRTPEGGYVVVSALGLSGWRIGDEVKDQRIIEAARPLSER